MRFRTLDYLPVAILVLLPALQEQGARPQVAGFLEVEGAGDVAKETAPWRDRSTLASATE